MLKKAILKIGTPVFFISITLVFCLLGVTIAISEEARTLPGYVLHRSVKVTPGKEQEAIDWSKEISDRRKSMGLNIPRKYLEKTDEGTLLHWIAEFPSKVVRGKAKGARKGDPMIKAIDEKYPDIFEGKMKVSDWQAIE